MFNPGINAFACTDARRACPSFGHQHAKILASFAYCERVFLCAFFAAGNVSEASVVRDQLEQTDVVLCSLVSSAAAAARKRGTPKNVDIK